ncbi:hypothetical protein [Actinoplanes sp. L3-i22]|uniref:hypothetical protein n=1 Tax=Actinoplanes sp. L3-i22 TaxID=2836373 RepID=UPI001C77ED7F|nr:hypothetical protein [Actinoplanes sp. L3-i22]BCY05310.1 hypothetical protein L3i22_003980 [Actinoplanes sp. L3-i22]
MSARTTSSILLAVAGAALFALTACATATPENVSPATTAATGAAAPTGAAAATSPARPVSQAKPVNGCPVTAEALVKVAKLPAGYKIDPASVKCNQNWAVGTPIAPKASQQGDGDIFFAYDPKTGAWVTKGAGSAVECGTGSQMNIPKSTGLCGDALYAN